MPIEEPFADDDLSGIIYPDATDGGVRPFMYNKIRILLSAIQRKEGWPARQNHKVAFYGLQMFSIPNDKVLSTYHTWDMWKDYKSTIWREVMLLPFAVHDSPMQMMDVLTGLFSLEFVTNVNIFGKIFDANNKTKWPIFENLLSIGGIANVVIDANWDKIKKRLNEHGY